MSWRRVSGTARGGAVFGIKDALGLPVRYIGTGETMELLEVFENAGPLSRRTDSIPGVAAKGAGPAQAETPLDRR